MPNYAVKLYFTSPLHVGELGMEDTSSLIHSDTLYSAIYQTWLKLFAVKGDLPIIITSAFPFVDEKYYLPKPGLEPPGFEDLEIREIYSKSIKGTSFLSEDIFKKWINGSPVDYKEMEKDIDILNTNIKKQIRPRVSLDRLSSTSALYHVGEVYFTPKRAGLYFIVNCTEDIYKKLKAVMRILSEEGLGGERSSGYGRFEVNYINNFIVPEVVNGKKYVTLSLYYPYSKEEFIGALESYQVSRRGGWTTGKEKNYPQKKVIMFSEGSVFNKEVKGKVVDVASSDIDHPVYKNGKVFLVKVR